LSVVLIVVFDSTATKLQSGCCLDSCGV